MKIVKNAIKIPLKIPSNVAPVQSITDIVLLNLWLMLLFWMFISSYTTIYFFVRKFIFRMFISVKKIFNCFYMIFGWERDHQLSTYATVVGRWGARKGECHASRVRMHLHYLFSCFWKHFCLIMSCFICRNLTLPFFKEDVLILIKQTES